MPSIAGNLWQSTQVQQHSDPGCKSFPHALMIDTACWATLTMDEDAGKTGVPIPTPTTETLTAETPIAPWGRPPFALVDGGSGGI